LRAALKGRKTLTSKKELEKQVLDLAAKLEVEVDVKGASAVDLSAMLSELKELEGDEPEKPAPAAPSAKPAPAASSAKPAPAASSAKPDEKPAPAPSGYKVAPGVSIVCNRELLDEGTEIKPADLSDDSALAQQMFKAHVDNGRVVPA